MKTIIEILERSKSNLQAEYNNIDTKITELHEETLALINDKEVLFNKSEEISRAIEILKKEGGLNESTSKNKKTKR
jgi:predicted nuclease with TOPRIM domain